MTVWRSNRTAQGNLQIYCDNASIVFVNYLYCINALVPQSRKSSQTELTIVTEAHLEPTSFGLYTKEKEEKNKANSMM